MILLFHSFIGFSADTCSVMFGCNHSVSILLKERIPDIVVVKCSCHSIHLVSSYASKKLPDELEATVRSIYNHFSRSSARRRDFANIQQFAEVEQHSILSPGQTRWLSREYCILCILEQMDPLIIYFTEEEKAHKTRAVGEIIQFLRLPLKVPFLLFLKYSLNMFNEFNTLFQSESPLFHRLESRVNDLIRDLANNFMLLKYVRNTNPSNVDPSVYQRNGMFVRRCHTSVRC